MCCTARPDDDTLCDGVADLIWLLDAGRKPFELPDSTSFYVECELVELDSDVPWQRTCCGHITAYALTATTRIALPGVHTIALGVRRTTQHQAYRA